MLNLSIIIKLPKISGDYKPGYVYGMLIIHKPNRHR